MWCGRCRYGCDGWRGGRCPQCGADGLANIGRSPFPSQPVKQGSGKPSGKTARKRAKGRVL